MASTADIRKRLDGMNDFQLLRFFDFFSGEVFKGLDVSLRDILANMSIDQQLMPEILAARQLNDDLATQALPRQEAVAFVRNLLYSWADDSTYAPLLAAGLENFQDTEQSADVILAIGAAVSMVLLSIGHSNLKLEAFGISISGGKQDKADKKQISQAFDDMPTAKTQLIDHSKHPPVIQLLKQGQIAEALDYLAEQTTDKNRLADILQLKNRYQHWAGSVRNDLFASREEEVLEMNRINNEVIELALN